MSLRKTIKAVAAELEALYKQPTSEETENRIEELEQEYDSLIWDLDAYIY